jgi:hypothetical protein
VRERKAATRSLAPSRSRLGRPDENQIALHLAVADRGNSKAVANSNVRKDRNR